MDLLDRLHDALLVARRSSGSQRALTVGDVYQHLVPYRGVRAELGIWELAQYEHTLLRLLAGERGYVAVPPNIQQELVRELSSSNPILGIYRDFAAAPVQLGASASSSSGGQSSDPESTPQPLPSADSVSRGAPPPAHSCRSCHSPLPDLEDLRYCPQCGTDQHVLACPSCGASMQPEWRFCVRCGNAR